MEILKELIPFAVRASLFFLVFAVGLDARFEDATYVLKRPKLLLRSLLAIAVIVPAFAALLVAMLPLMRVVKIAIILMAVSPLPPFMPGKDIKLGGRKPYVYGLLVAVSVLSVVIVPVTVAILSAAFAEDVSIAPGPVAGLILSSLIFPLAVGMMIRRISPERAEHAAPMMSKIATIMLVVAVLPLLLSVLPAILHLIGNGSVVAIAAAVAAGLLAGHTLGGPDPHDRAALAIASTTRHPGVALLIAHANFREPDVNAAILLFVIVGMLAAMPYQLWYKRHYPVMQ